MIEIEEKESGERENGVNQTPDLSSSTPATPWW